MEHIDAPKPIHHETTVPGSSLGPKEFKSGLDLIAAAMAGDESTSFDPTTGAIFLSTMTPEAYAALTPNEQEAFIEGASKKQAKVIDAIRNEEKEK